MGSRVPGFAVVADLIASPCAVVHDACMANTYGFTPDQLQQQRYVGRVAAQQAAEARFATFAKLHGESPAQAANEYFKRCVHHTVEASEQAICGRPGSRECAAKKDALIAQAIAGGFRSSVLGKHRWMSSPFGTRLSEQDRLMSLGDAMGRYRNSRRAVFQDNLAALMGRTALPEDYHQLQEHHPQMVETYYQHQQEALQRERQQKQQQEIATGRQLRLSPQGQKAWKALQGGAPAARAAPPNVFEEEAPSHGPEHLWAEEEEPRGARPAAAPGAPAAAAPGKADETLPTMPSLVSEWAKAFDKSAAA